MTPSTSTRNSDSSQVREASSRAAAASPGSPASEATQACWWRTDPAHDPLGATTASYPSKAATCRRTSGTASGR